MGKRQALEGIRVISFCWAAAGPIITRTLAEHGAEVINIESNTIFPFPKIKIGEI